MTVHVHHPLPLHASRRLTGAVLQVADAPPADAGFPPFPGTGQPAGSQQPPPQSGDGDKPKFSIDMLEMLMRDEKMQETMYQYLPENMRNKETFDWMLSNPEFRGQLQTMLEKQASAASLVAMLLAMDRPWRDSCLAI